MPCLGRAFFDAVDVFNTTFAKANPPAPTLNNFAPYYDPNITMHTPHLGIQRPRGQVLSNLAASAPLYFDPSVSKLQIDENAGIVKGNTCTQIQIRAKLKHLELPSRSTMDGTPQHREGG